jgi:molybdate transport system substrate-binding protein
MMSPLKVVSSKATKAVLEELLQELRTRSGPPIAFESVGGVDLARRVQAGEAIDVVVLGADALDALVAAGHLSAESKVDVAKSPLAVAVRAGSAHPDIATEAALRRAVLDARRVSYSTGPSGVAIAQLFERWGISSSLRERVTVPAPGVAVATLLAKGEVELGFQQLPELLGVEGVDVVGLLPESIAVITTFSAAVSAGCRDVQAARSLLAFFTSAETSAAKERYGMLPA